MHQSLGSDNVELDFGSGAWFAPASLPRPRHNNANKNYVDVLYVTHNTLLISRDNDAHSSYATRTRTAAVTSHSGITRYTLHAWRYTLHAHCRSKNSYKLMYGYDDEYDDEYGFDYWTYDGYYYVHDYYYDCAS